MSESSEAIYRIAPEPPPVTIKASATSKTELWVGDDWIFRFDTETGEVEANTKAAKDEAAAAIVKAMAAVAREDLRPSRFTAEADRDRLAVLLRDAVFAIARPGGARGTTGCTASRIVAWARPAGS